MPLAGITIVLPIVSPVEIRGADPKTARETASPSLDSQQERTPKETHSFRCGSSHIYVLFYYLAFNKEKLKDTFSLTPLYLRDLVKSAEAKRWILPERTS